MLSDIMLMGIDIPTGWKAPFTDEQVMHLVRMRRDMTGVEVRDWYEEMITAGVLHVVKMIPRSEAMQHVLSCSEHMNDAMDAHFEDYIDFCPGCGAAIVPG